MQDDDSFTIDSPRSERRVHPRYEILAQVKFKHLKTTYVMDVANISRSGLFIKTSESKHLIRVRVGDELELDVFAQEELENVRVMARVVRVVAEGTQERWGFGVKFVRVTPRTDGQIQRLVDRAARAASSRPPPLPTAGRGGDPF